MHGPGRPLPGRKGHQWHGLEVTRWFWASRAPWSGPETVQGARRAGRECVVSEAQHSPGSYGLGQTGCCCCQSSLFTPSVAHACCSLWEKVSGGAVWGPLPLLVLPLWESSICSQSSSSAVDTGQEYSRTQGKSRGPRDSRPCARLWCVLFQTGIPGLDWSEAIKIHESEARQSHHNPQLWMGRQPQGQFPGQWEAGAWLWGCNNSGFSVQVRD